MLFFVTCFKITDLLLSSIFPPYVIYTYSFFSVLELSLSQVRASTKVSVMLKLHPEVLGLLATGRFWVDEVSFWFFLFFLFTFSYLQFIVFRQHDVLQFHVEVCVLEEKCNWVAVGLLMGIPKLWNKAVPDWDVCILLYYQRISQCWTDKNFNFKIFQKRNVCIGFYFVTVKELYACFLQKIISKTLFFFFFFLISWECSWKRQIIEGLKLQKLHLGQKMWKNICNK